MVLWCCCTVKINPRVAAPRTFTHRIAAADTVCQLLYCIFHATRLPPLVVYGYLLAHTVDARNNQAGGGLRHPGPQCAALPDGSGIKLPRLLTRHVPLMTFALIRTSPRLTMIPTDPLETHRDDFWKCFFFKSYVVESLFEVFCCGQASDSEIWSPGVRGKSLAWWQTFISREPAVLSILIVLAVPEVQTSPIATECPGQAILPAFPGFTRGSC